MHQVVIGSQTSKLVGFALSLRGKYRATVPPVCRWITEFDRTCAKKSSRNQRTFKANLTASLP